MSTKRELLEAECQALITHIEACLTQAHNGATPVLGDMDKRAIQLCQDVQNADAETAQALQPVMLQMISRLNDLVSALEEFGQDNNKP